MEDALNQRGNRGSFRQLQVEAVPRSQVFIFQLQDIISALLNRWEGDSGPQLPAQGGRDSGGRKGGLRFSPFPPSTPKPEDPSLQLNPGSLEPPLQNKGARQPPPNSAQGTTAGGAPGPRGGRLAREGLAVPVQLSPPRRCGPARSTPCSSATASSPGA